MPNPSESDDESDSEGTVAEDADGDPAAWWNEAYASDADLPWEIGEPQPAFVEYADEEGLEGRVLDVGCGTGTHARWAAERGHASAGVDVSEVGIERARAKADERGLDVTFRVVNALGLPDDLGPFDTVLDSGLFHAFEADERDTYADELAGVVSSGGRVLIVGFGDGAPEDGGPNPFSRADVRAAFSDDDWSVSRIRDAAFETRETSVTGLFAVVERLKG